MPGDPAVIVGLVQPAEPVSRDLVRTAFRPVGSAEPRPVHRLLPDQVSNKMAVRYPVGELRDLPPPVARLRKTIRFTRR